MTDEIIFIYSFCHDLLRELGVVDDNQCIMNAAKIMTVAFVGALYFQGNHDLAMRFLKDHLYIVHMLSILIFGRLCSLPSKRLWPKPKKILSMSSTAFPWRRVTRPEAIGAKS
jgi:hypothetical protein